MRKLLARWPLMLRSTHEAVRRENYTLRDALREANNEVRKHQRLLTEIRSGSGEMVDRVLKVKV